MHSSRLHRSDSYIHDRCTRVEDRKIEDPREEEAAAAARNSVESLIPCWLAHRNADFPYRVTGPLANAGWVILEFHARTPLSFSPLGQWTLLGFTSTTFLLRYRRLPRSGRAYYGSVCKFSFIESKRGISSLSLQITYPIFCISFMTDYLKILEAILLVKIGPKFFLHFHIHPLKSKRSTEKLSVTSISFQ